MRSFLFLLLMSFSVVVDAEADPCSVNSYPLKWQGTLQHASSYTAPAIYYKHESSRVIVTVKDAIEIVEKNMSESEPFLRKAKAHIIDSLKSIDSSGVIAHSLLWIPMDELVDEELNVAIHVMYGYQLLFEKALLTKLAVVEINNNVVEQTVGKYTVGKDPEALSEFEYVHKFSISHKRHIVFDRCWLDKT